jgi:hypothetical protein
VRSFVRNVSASYEAFDAKGSEIRGPEVAATRSGQSRKEMEEVGDDVRSVDLSISKRVKPFR